MSDFYEFALLFSIKPDVSQEVIDTLQYMTQGQAFNSTPSLSNSIFSEPVREVVHPLGVTMHVVPAWCNFFRDEYTEFEQYLSGSFGSSFFEDSLAVRRVIHEDIFYNFWDELGSWLASISATAGLVGYYRNLEDDSIEDANLICFEDGQISEFSVEDIQTIDNFLQNLETVLSFSDR